MSAGQQFTGALTYLILQSRRRDKVDTALRAVFLSLQLADLVMTLVAARFGYPELNPFMKQSLDSLAKLAVFKFGVPVLISWFVPGRLLVPAILLLCGVVGWNVRELVMLAV